MAACLEALGKVDEAAQQYAAALAKTPDDLQVLRRVVPYYIRTGNFHEAEIHLRRVVDGQLPAPPDLITGARRELAIGVLAAQGGYPNLVEAIRLLDQNLAADPGSVTDLRAKARLLSRHPSHTVRQQAISILEKLASDPKTESPEDQFLLVQLYKAEGDWPKARRNMITLLARHGDQPRYVAAFAEDLIGHKEIGDAETWVHRLETIAPDNASIAPLRAAVFFNTGRPDEAVGILEKFIEKAPADSPDRAARTLVAAAQLEQGAALADQPAGAAATAAKEKAEVLYRQLAAQDPKYGFALVAFLARQKRLDEALASAAEACKTAEPLQMSVNCEMLLRRPGIAAAQVDRLAAILGTALEKRARPSPLLLVMAEVRTQQEKFAEVETVYREVLQKDPHNIRALNNLAELLALRGQKSQEALALVEEAIKWGGPIPAFLDTRASVLLALGQPEKALADLDEVIAQSPQPQDLLPRGGRASEGGPARGSRQGPERGAKETDPRRGPAPSGASRLLRVGPLAAVMLRSRCCVSAHSLDGDWSIFRREIAFGAKNVEPKTWTCPLSRRTRV